MVCCGCIAACYAVLATWAFHDLFERFVATTHVEYSACETENGESADGDADDCAGAEGMRMGFDIMAITCVTAGFGGMCCFRVEFLFGEVFPWGQECGGGLRVGELGSVVVGFIL